MVDAAAYSLLQQQLITTRARLDRQVSQLTRLNQLSDRLLRRPDEHAVAEVFAEAVVDVLDLAVGAVWVLPRGNPNLDPDFAVFGSPVPLVEWTGAGRRIADWLAGVPSRGAVRLDPGIAGSLPGPGIVEPLVCRAVTRDGTCAALVLAANTRLVAGMDVPDGEDTAALLTLLAEKMAAHIDSSADRRLIDDQVQQLSESEQQMERVLRSTNDGWWDWDLRSNQCFVSARWQELTGTLDEFPLREGFWLQQIHQDDRATFGGALDAAIAGGAPVVEMEVRLVRPDGTEFPALIRGTVATGADGRANRFAGSVLDLTERKRQEEELRRVEARLLESAKLEALGVLAGGIAHDFNNLLAAIMGNIDLARAELEEGDFADRTLEAAERAAERAAELARQMLAYSGRGTFSVGPVAVGDLLRDMADLVRSSVAKSATLVHDHEPGLPFVRADQTQLRQVALNLIVNASDALGGEPGEIRMRTAMTTLESGDPAVIQGTDAAPGEYVMLEVSDTGRGMDKATLARIFDPFFSTKSAGRGLGLASTLGIVKGHKGALRVWSEPGRGTRFQVLLPPLPQATPGVTIAAVPEPEAPVTGRVMVVDDDTGVRAVARQALERAGFSVIETSDGPEAVQIFGLAPDRIDAVLLDVTLATTDGLTVLAQLREIRPQIPVVLCSGWSNQEVAGRLAETPLTDFVQKPFRAHAVVDAIRRQLRLARLDEEPSEG